MATALDGLSADLQEVYSQWAKQTPDYVASSTASVKEWSDKIQENVDYILTQALSAAAEESLSDESKAPIQTIIAASRAARQLPCATDGERKEKIAALVALTVLPIAPEQDTQRLLAMMETLRADWREEFPEDSTISAVQMKKWQERLNQVRQLAQPLSLKAEKWETIRALDAQIYEVTKLLDSEQELEAKIAPLYKVLHDESLTTNIRLAEIQGRIFRNLTQLIHTEAEITTTEIQLAAHVAATPSRIPMRTASTETEAAVLDSVSEVLNKAESLSERSSECTNLTDQLSNSSTSLALGSDSSPKKVAVPKGQKTASLKSLAEQIVDQTYQATLAVPISGLNGVITSLTSALPEQTQKDLRAKQENILGKIAYSQALQQGIHSNSEKESFSNSLEKAQKTLTKFTQQAEKSRTDLDEAKLKLLAADIQVQQAQQALTTSIAHLSTRAAKKAHRLTATENKKLQQENLAERAKQERIIEQLENELNDLEENIAITRKAITNSQQHIAGYERRDSLFKERQENLTEAILVEDQTVHAARSQAGTEVFVGGEKKDKTLPNETSETKAEQETVEAVTATPAAAPAETAAPQDAPEPISIELSDQDFGQYWQHCLEQIQQHQLIEAEITDTESQLLLMEAKRSMQTDEKN